MMCTGFVLDWRLSTERVAAQPLYLFPFPPGLEVLVIIILIATLCLFIQSCEDCICILEFIVEICLYT